MSSSPLDSALEESLRCEWNARVVNYDADRYPFAGWILDEIRRLGHPLDSLERLHEVVPREDVYVLSKALCDSTNRPEFRDLVNAFVREEIAVHGNLLPPLAAQRFLNVRVMLPDKPQGVFPFHTGLLYGHGPASRSLWLPLTDVSREEDRSASLQIIELQRSRELLAQATAENMSIPEMTDLFGAASEGIRARPGQVLLFSQENIHGNFVNRTGKTRVSIDFRIAEGRFGDRLARKIPGGYFEPVPMDSDRSHRPQHSLNERPNVIYINNNTEGTKTLPPHLQRLSIYDHAERNRLGFDFELFELESMAHLPTLRHLIEDLKCNALMYSIYALPEARETRSAIYRAARANQVRLVFANEDLVLDQEGDEERIEALLTFAKYGAQNGTNGSGSAAREDSI